MVVRKDRWDRHSYVCRRLCHYFLRFPLYDRFACLHGGTVRVILLLLFSQCGDDDDSSSSGNWQDLSKTYEGKSVYLVMGEVTIPVDGKSVVIAASSAEKASVTLNNIIPEISRSLSMPH